MAIPRNLANLAPKLSATGGSFATTIGVGAATPAASGSGISFPATQSASSDANTLDDYEEGTWTPSYSQGVTSPVYTNTGGFYKKVGALVFVSGNIQLSGGTGNASQILIAGLPFANGSGTGIGAAISVAYNAGFKTDGAFTMIIGGSSSVIDFYTFSGSNFSGSSATNVQALLTFSGCYQV